MGNDGSTCYHIEVLLESKGAPHCTLSSPLFLIISNYRSIQHFSKALWTNSSNKTVSDKKIILII